jgi:hypothetical protein
MPAPGRSTTNALIAVFELLDDINRNVNNVAARLDGKQGRSQMR